MNRILLVTLLLTGVLSISKAQTPTTFKSSILHAEVFGYSLNQISLNYERVFSDRNPIKVGCRGGVGIDGIIFNTDYSRYTLTANMFGFIGQKSSHLEFGTGLSYLKGSFVKYEIPNSTLYLPINLSYRFQRPLKPLFFKVGIYQFFKLVDFAEMPDYTTPKITYTFGVAVGCTFYKKKKSSESQ